jgi:hypothetical protein
MVRALLNGSKTQTRRANHLERLRRFGPITEFGRSDTKGYDWHFRDKEKRWHDLRHGDLLKYLPWQVGNRLYVRETWAPLVRLTHNDPGTQALSDRGFYQADGGTVAGEITRWTPAIHQPRWASRLTLTVTTVRVQRLQDISEADAKAEGAKFFVPANHLSHGGWSHNEWHLHETAKQSFAGLWGDINGDGSWNANPWVAAYTFSVQRGNIDQIEVAA